MSYNRSDSEVPVIALDNGSSACRMGFAGDEAPISEFPNYVGRPLYKPALALSEDSGFIGDEAQKRRETLSLSYPVQRGIVTNWDDMEKVWQHGFTEIKADLTESAIITSEPPLNPRGNSEKMTEVMFETFGVPAFHMGYEPDHILFAYGRGSGVMISIGHGVSFVSSVYEGGGPMSEQRFDFGGVDLTMKLQELLFERGHSFTTSSELDELSQIKEKASYVRGMDNATHQPVKTGEIFDYTLPDGTSLSLDSERYTCPDLLFHPDGNFNSGPSIPDMICSCIQESCITSRPDLFVNFLVCGGTSLIPGFTDRLQEELIKRFSKKNRVRVISGPERLHTSWIGKSIHGSLSYFGDYCVEKQQYEEYGPQAMHGRVAFSLVRRNSFEVQEN